MRDTDGKRDNVVDGEDERPLDQAVDHQPMLDGSIVGTPE